jgi:hypothetical protein
MSPPPGGDPDPPILRDSFSCDGQHQQQQQHQQQHQQHQQPQRELGRSPVLFVCVIYVTRTPANSFCPLTPAVVVSAMHTCPSDASADGCRSSIGKASRG